MAGINKLTATVVKAHAGKKRLSDGGGLALVPQRSGSVSWVYRFMIHGRSREMGLGSYPTISLGEARRLAADARALVALKIDPIQAREDSIVTEKTFGEIAEQFLELRASKGTHPKTDWQWQRDLRETCRTFNTRPISSIKPDDVARILKPMWITKWETADRLRRRLANVFDLAISEELILLNPASAVVMANKLPQRPEQRRVRHHPSMEYKAVPAFIRSSR